MHESKVGDAVGTWQSRTCTIQHGQSLLQGGLRGEKGGLSSLGQPGAAVSKSSWPGPRWPLACGPAQSASLVTEEMLSSVLPRGHTATSPCQEPWFFFHPCSPAPYAGHGWALLARVYKQNHWKLQESVHVYRQNNCQKWDLGEIWLSLPLSWPHNLRWEEVLSGACFLSFY